MLALLVLAAAPQSYGVDRSGSRPPAGDRPSPTVVVQVSTGGFDWQDAALGAVATVATGLLVFGLVLAMRAGR